MLKFFNKIGENEYEIILSGEIGWSVNGKEIAKEIRYLNTIGAKKITERINSPGGNVVDAYDIVDANINSQAVIETIVTGLAGSAAGWIAATGTKGNRKIVDYGMGMIHDPSMGGDTIETTKDEKIKTALLAIKESIATIFVNVTGKIIDEIKSLMTKETWFLGDAWVSNGFADKVIKTNNKKARKENMTPMEIMNYCVNVGFQTLIEEEVITNQNSNMKLLLGHLNLAEAANETQILDAIKKIEKDLSDVTTENATLKAANKTLTDEKVISDGKIKVFTDKQKAENVAKVLTIVDQAVKDGKIRESEKAHFITLFGEDSATAENTMKLIAIPGAKITDKITETNTGIPADRKDWTLRDWEKKDEAGLNKIKADNLPLYKEMYKKEYEKEYVE